MIIRFTVNANARKRRMRIAITLEIRGICAWEILPEKELEKDRTFWDTFSVSVPIFAFVPNGKYDGAMIIM